MSLYLTGHPPHTWTVDEHIDALERQGVIVEPFTLKERELARNIAAAWHFVWNQQELPGRCLEDSVEMNSIDMGIMLVRQIRGDVGRRTSPATTA
jgi:hypothetical protein